MRRIAAEAKPTKIANITWHHSGNGHALEAVSRKYHKMFTHKGGFSSASGGKKMKFDGFGKVTAERIIRTNKFTLELVDRGAHQGIRHAGGCKQYEVFKGVRYK